MGNLTFRIDRVGLMVDEIWNVSFSKTPRLTKVFVQAKETVAYSTVGHMTSDFFSHMYKVETTLHLE